MFFRIIFSILLLQLAGCGDSDSFTETPDDIFAMSVQLTGRSDADRLADDYRKPEEILRFASPKPGMTVIDLLGGSGYYAELLNPIVGDSGKVYIQNNSLFLRFSGDTLSERLSGGRLANVERLDSEFSDMQLPEGTDMVVMGLSYHDIYVPREDPVIMTNRDEFLPQVWEALKPGGQLLIIDHAAEKGSGASAAATLHRIERDYVIEDLTSFGFELDSESNVLRNDSDNYSKDIWDSEVFHKTDRFVLLFRKPAPASESPDGP